MYKNQSIFLKKPFSGSKIMWTFYISAQIPHLYKCTNLYFYFFDSKMCRETLVSLKMENVWNAEQNSETFYAWT